MLRLLHCKLIILPSGLDANKWQQAMTLAAVAQRLSVVQVGGK